MKTLAIIKPDAVAKGAVGFCLQMAETRGLKVRNLRWVQLTEATAGGFYVEHFGKNFYDKLVKFMASGPCVAVVLEGENAVSEWREVMQGIRKVEADPAHSERNAVHGSDSSESARKELEFFFGEA